MMKQILFASSAATLGALVAVAPVASAPAYAAAPRVMPGMQVIDTAGNPVGIISAVKGATVILKTDTHEISLPSNSFTPNKGKLLFGMTRAQVNAAADQAAAAAKAAMVTGAKVYGKGGTLAGHIQELDETYATIELTSGDLVRLPRNGLAPGHGGAIVGITAAELQAAADQAKGGQAVESTGG